MRGRNLALLTLLSSLIALPALVSAQQAQSPWPAPPGAQQPDVPPGAEQPPPPSKKKKSAKKKAPPQEAPDPRFEEEPGMAPADGPPPNPGPVPAPARPRPAATLDIKCDGPFARNTTFALLVKTFGVRNVFSQPGGVTILFQNDPKRRIEITWRDVVARTRPAMILIEAQSTWRVRGFRLGDPMAQVEKVNGRPFRFAGFGATPGGNARDWQGGKLDKLSGGCLLGMRFAPNPGAPPDALRQVNLGGDLASDDPNVRAVAPGVIEMIVGYPE